MNLPESFTSSIEKLLGADEAEQLFKSLETSAPVSVRLNTSKIKRYGLAFASEKREAIPWCSNAYYLSERPTFTFDPLFHGGAYYVQEASSMFIAHILEQHLDKTKPVLALDLCAAPGGKSSLLRGFLPEGSLLVANEIVSKRAQILSENILKWGHPDVLVTNNSAVDFEKTPLSFDVVLADVPCSGEGMFRKDEAAIEEWSPQNVEVCWQRQREIVSSIWQNLKPGGLFIYSTCTFNSKENEENVQWIIDTLGAESLAVTTDSNWNISPALQGFEQYSYRFLPHKTKGEGFFVAALRKPLSDGQQAPACTKSKKKKKKKLTAQAAIHQRLFQPAKDWVSVDDSYDLLIEDETCFVFRKQYFAVLDVLKQYKFHLIHAGTPLAYLKGKSCLPHPALAFSALYKEAAFSQVELSYEQAISYLRKEAIALAATTSKGFVLLTYKQLPLGFVKHLGNRSNNLYPAPWRIRSGYLPDEIKTL